MSLTVARFGTCVACLVYVSGVAWAQDSVNVSTAKIAAAYIAGKAATSVGVSWDARFARSWSDTSSKPSVPSDTCFGLRASPELAGELATDGAAALDADANATPLRASAKLELFWSLYKPGCSSQNPGEPTRSGWYFGSVLISTHTKLEANQRMTEVNGLFGADLLWTHSQVTGVWPLVPSLQLAYGVAIPLRSMLRDSLAQRDGAYRRGEVHVVWHIPLGARFELHANVRRWKSYGLPSALVSAGANDGTFTAVDLAYGADWRLGRVVIPEVFVRHVSGEVPEDWRQHRTWMIGIRVGR